ncbi:MAG: NBR1-Ig-like domain-containing protein [Myxococcota bacterium]|nr:NBR1-Ig-like domain-containing protein [Myxococcota bacterium]
MGTHQTDELCWIPSNYGPVGGLLVLLMLGLGPGCADTGDQVKPGARNVLAGDTGSDQLGAEDTGETEQTDPSGDVDETGDTTGTEDGADLESVDLPLSMGCGDSYSASVEMRNTGQTTWTREDGYKLGAVNDEDSLYGPDVRVWLPEDVSVAPGESHVFDFELTAPQEEDDYLTDWQMVHEGVQWFGESTAETVVVACTVQTFCDPLTDSSLQSGFEDKSISGGSFTSAGWQTTDDEDQVRIEMSTPITGDGMLEIDVTNFDPETQYSSTKHQIINLYTSDDGSQNVFETDEAWWNVRTGTNYGTGFKFLAAGNGGDSRDEVRITEDASWDPADTHTFTVEWDSEYADIYLDGTLMETLPFDGRVQPLQHVFIGKDNVYVGQVGPVYSNLCVTQYP